MLKSLIRGKFIGSRSVNNPPEHFVNNQVLTAHCRPDGPTTETVRLYLPVSPVRLRDDEGIVPYASMSPYHSSGSGLNF